MTTPTLDATDKVVVVTGASKGLGRAMALGFAAAGAHVVVTDVWTSMGQEAEVDERALVFPAYALDAEKVAVAAPDVTVGLGRVDAQVKTALAGPPKGR